MEKVERRLAQAMNERGVTAAELSRITGISKSSLSRYMSGEYNPNNKKLAILSKALNVDEAWLLGYEGVEMERKSEEVRAQQSHDIEQDMSDMMIGKITSFWSTLTFEQRVEIFAMIRRKELDYEATKQNRDNL